MLRKGSNCRVVSFLIALAVGLSSQAAFAAAASQGPDKMTLWQLIVSGGTCMIFLGIISVIATASVIYHFINVSVQRQAPQDMVENLLTLLERKEYDKATSICRQQPNLISAIALKGLEKMPKGKVIVEEAIQYEGKARIEGLWQNLTYLGDIAVIAPMVGLLGTILGMIDAFHYFRAEAIHPVVLTQGLAKAMINTAFGLVIAVPTLAFYSYFRGKISRITSTAEAVSSEIVQIIAR